MHKNKREDLNDKYFILFQKNLWIFSEEEWEKKKYYNALNKAYGKKIATSNLHDTLANIRDSHYTILDGKIEDDTIFLLSDRDFRQSEHSADLYKLKNELDMPIKLRFYSGYYHDTEEEINIDVDKKQLADRKFFHGTSLNFLKGILKTGLMPTDSTNYKNINHEDKIFFTLNIEKAYTHALNAAIKNESFPIIIELKVPDVSKLVVDYDLAKDVYGDGSEVVRTLNYDKFDANKADGIDYKKDITNKIGVYGYVGRIPLSYIQDIWIDIRTYGDNLDVFGDNGEYDPDRISEIEFDDVMNWSEISKADIINRLNSLQNDFDYRNDEYDEDNEDEDDE